MLYKICSGAQTGADIGGLITAKKYGLETGGWIPKGFKTQVGPRPEYAALYGIKEHSSSSYPGRTFLNVKETDGTIRFAEDFGTSGEACTLKAILQYNKPYFDVPILGKKDFNSCIQWLQNNNIQILNVAGNSERTFMGMQMETSAYLEQLFELLGFKPVSLQL